MKIDWINRCFSKTEKRKVISSDKFDLIRTSYISQSVWLKIIRLRNLLEDGNNIFKEKRKTGSKNSNSFRGVDDNRVKDNIGEFDRIMEQT